jgi:hypothetical protein
MSDVLSLKEAERKAFQLSNSHDGLYDIFFGVFIAALSSMAWLDENGLRTPWNFILVEAIGFAVLLGVLITKKFVVAPRVGQVRFGPERKKRIRQLAVVMGIAFALTVGLFLLTLTASQRGPVGQGFKLDIVHVGAGLFMWAVFSFIGWMKDFPRMILYGWIFGSGYVISTILQDLTAGLFQWPLAISGVIVTAIGVVIFVRFLEKYPLSGYSKVGGQ